MKIKLIFLAAISTLLALSCNKKADEPLAEETTSTVDVSTQALTIGAAHASSTEGGNKAISSQFTVNELNVLEEEIQFAKNNSIPASDRAVQAANECKYSSIRKCTSGTGTVAWDSCTIAGPKLSLTMTGSWTETWSNTGDCTNGYLSLNESVTRKSSGSIINYPGGANVTTDTVGGTAYDGTVLVSGEVIIARAQALVRSVAMTPTNSAIHKVYKSNRGTSLFDYYSSPSLSVSGTRSNGTSNNLSGTSGSDRAINGTVKIYHNTAKYSATNQFSGVTWSDALCCFPTSGSVTTSYTGVDAPAGPTTLTFTTSCGTASYATPDNSAGTSVTLFNCQ